MPNAWQIETVSVDSFISGLQADSETTATKQVGLLRRNPIPGRVTGVNGNWLWIDAAWVRVTDVMDVNEALEFATKRIKANSRDDKAWYLRGVLWLEKGENESAAKDFMVATALKPLEGAYWNNLGLACLRTAR